MRPYFRGIGLAVAPPVSRLWRDTTPLQSFLNSAWTVFPGSRRGLSCIAPLAAHRARIAKPRRGPIHSLGQRPGTRHNPVIEAGAAAKSWHMRQVFFNRVAIAIAKLLPGFSRHNLSHQLQLVVLGQAVSVVRAGFSRASRTKDLSRTCHGNTAAPIEALKEPNNPMPPNRSHTHTARESRC